MKFRPGAAVVALMLGGLAGPALAGEGGGGDPAVSPLGWAFRWINFGIVLGGLLYLLLKKAPGFFRRRAAAIVSSITEAAETRAEAQRRLRESEEKLARLDREVAEIRAAAQRDAAGEAERIRAMAREEGKKVERAAAAEIQAAERTARMELRALAAGMAVERAEALLRGRMDAPTQAALVQRFVENLERVS